MCQATVAKHTFVPASTSSMADIHRVRNRATPLQERRPHLEYSTGATD